MSEKQPMTMQVGGLEEEVPELTLAERIPSPSILEELPSILLGLPGQVTGLLSDIPDMIASQFDHDHEMGG